MTIAQIIYPVVFGRMVWERADTVELLQLFNLYVLQKSMFLCK